MWAWRPTYRGSQNVCCFKHEYDWIHYARFFSTIIMETTWNPIAEVNENRFKTYLGDSSPHWICNGLSSSMINILPNPRLNWPVKSLDIIRFSYRNWVERQMSKLSSKYEVRSTPIQRQKLYQRHLSGLASLIPTLELQFILTSLLAWITLPNHKS